MESPAERATLEDMIIQLLITIGSVVGVVLIGLLAVIPPLLEVNSSRGRLAEPSSPSPAHRPSTPRRPTRPRGPVDLAA